MRKRVIIDERTFVNKLGESLWKTRPKFRLTWAGMSCWGSIHHTLAYKAARRNKLVGLVPAAYTSQECSPCGHIHPENR
ncbi:zinc ribbon domain-containing protein, partial [Caballeronia mineralivorans]|uniref:zinc ribbon domain-containing protein n=1 Tax=Caballeronia mineralivorans TaxID=2010198 RepID=UPI0023F555F4